VQERQKRQKERERERSILFEGEGRKGKEREIKRISSLYVLCLAALNHLPSFLPTEHHNTVPSSAVPDFLTHNLLTCSSTL
jgi:hypothetical protein